MMTRANSKDSKFLPVIGLSNFLIKRFTAKLVPIIILLHKLRNSHGLITTYQSLHGQYFPCTLEDAKDFML